MPGGGVILHDVEGREGKSEVVGLIVNTGVGPDIEVLFEQGDLRYEVLRCLINLRNSRTIYSS